MGINLTKYVQDTRRNLKFVENIKENINEQWNILCSCIGGLNIKKILIFPDWSINSVWSNQNPNSVFLGTWQADSKSHSN